MPFNNRAPSQPPQRESSTAPQRGSTSQRRQSGSHGKSKTFVCSTASAVEGASGELIHTQRGVGYILRAED